MVKRILCLVMAALILFALGACSQNGKYPPAPSETPRASGTPKATPAPTPSPAPKAEIDPTLLENTVKIKIEMQDGGIIKADLYPDLAPITVANFKKLIEEKFYDGLTFHRIIKGFMIQGGDPTGTGSGDGSVPEIKGEFSANGVQNDLLHTRGVLSMARAEASMDSASSQFFIVHEDSSFLDGKYAAFGKVTEGMEIVDAIAESTQVEDQNGTVLPENQPRVKSIVLE